MALHPPHTARKQPVRLPRGSNGSAALGSTPWRAKPSAARPATPAAQRPATGTRLCICMPRRQYTAPGRLPGRRWRGPLQVHRGCAFEMLDYSGYMSLSTRLRFIWLLVLALSVQGAGAASMVFCGPNHHGSSSASTPVQAHEMHHGSRAPVAHDQHQVATQQDEYAKASTTSAPSAPASDTNQQKCSACASCCTLSAILNAVVEVAAPVPSPTLFYAVVRSVDPYASEGPHRPPRIVLA